MAIPRVNKLFFLLAVLLLFLVPSVLAKLGHIPTPGDFFGRIFSGDIFSWDVSRETIIWILKAVISFSAAWIFYVIVHYVLVNGAGLPNDLINRIVIPLALIIFLVMLLIPLQKIPELISTFIYPIVAVLLFAIALGMIFALRFALTAIPPGFLRILACIAIIVFAGIIIWALKSLFTLILTGVGA